MPRFDGTGPIGDGPMTGGGFGYCGSGRRLGYQQRGRGFYGGFEAGRGFGRGLGRAYGWASPNRAPWGAGVRPRAFDSKTELATLQQEAEGLQAYLKDLEARIAEVKRGFD